MRVAFEHLRAEYPVLVDRYCDDGRDDRQNVMMLAAAVWSHEAGADTVVVWEPQSRHLATGADAIFLVLFSVAAYTLKTTIDEYRAAGHGAIIVCGPHAVSFPEHCRRAGADAVVGRRCDQALFQTILLDVGACRLKRDYCSEKPPSRLPHYETARALGFVPEQGFANVLSATGCPYDCSFCTDADQDYAPFSADEVVADIAGIDSPLVIFNDPLFGLGNAGQAVLHELGKLQDRHFMAFTSASLLRQPKIRRQFAESHFVLLEVGLESLHVDYAKNRRVDLIDTFRDCPCIVVLNYIYGLHPKDFEAETGAMLGELADHCPNVLPMVFVPFSLPETAMHQENLAANRLFDPSYLAIGSEILSMRLPDDMSPAEYYERIDGLNDRLWTGRNQRLHEWIENHAGIGDRTKDVMLQMAARQRSEGENADRWSAIVAANAPTEAVPFGAKVLAAAVPDFSRYDLAW